MKHAQIGSLSVSQVGLGCNNFGGRLDAAGSERVVKAALDAGIDFFDTADVYGEQRSEQILGAVLRGVRERVVIATKFGAPGSADEGSRAAVARGSTRGRNAASKRLRPADYIDLYQIHFPDADMPIEETRPRRRTGEGRKGTRDRRLQLRLDAHVRGRRVAADTGRAAFRTCRPATASCTASPSQGRAGMPRTGIRSDPRPSARVRAC